MSLQTYYDIADTALTVLPLMLALAGSAVLAVRLHAFHR